MRVEGNNYKPRKGEYILLGHCVPVLLRKNAYIGLGGRYIRKIRGKLPKVFMTSKKRFVFTEEEFKRLPYK